MSTPSHEPRQPTGRARLVPLADAAVLVVALALVLGGLTWYLFFSGGDEGSVPLASSTTSPTAAKPTAMKSTAATSPDTVANSDANAVAPAEGDDMRQAVQSIPLIDLPTTPTAGRVSGGGGRDVTAAPADRKPSAATVAPVSVANLIAGSSFQHGDPADPMVFAMHPSVRYAALLPDTTTTAAGRPTPSSAPTDGWALMHEALRLEEARRFTTSMCRDHEGRLWVGCENEQPGDGTGGVQCFDPSAPPRRQWKQYSVKDGLGDDNGHAIACDNKNRIWVGHLNHGVSVFDHNREGHWQCYEVVGGLSRPDTLSGPLGERVFAIKCSPTDGDVWIATNGGLARYSDAKRSWTYYTRADGLPGDQASSLAFDKDGNLYVGTQCDGVAMADASDDYKHWRRATGPQEEPTTPTGDGLPTNLINDVLVRGEGTVYAATNAGLAWSTDHGSTWRYVRGRDYADKVRGRVGGPPDGWNEAAPSTSTLLAEDYCTSLAEDESGLLWIGHRTVPVERRPTSTPAGGNAALFGKPVYATSMVSGTASPVLGTYGDGVQILRSPARKSNLGVSNPSLAPAAMKPTLPAGQPSPGLDQLNAALASLGEVPKGEDTGGVPFIAALNDDWMTQGDWLGHYGRYWCILSAMDGEGGYRWGGSPDPMAFTVSLGPGARKTDFVRYWTYAYYTSARRTLEIPPIYFHSRVLRGLTTWDVDRRQVDWDDHGEAGYPLTAQGPGLRMKLGVPEGTFVVSLYMINDDGHTEANRWRDYTLNVSTPGSNDDPAASKAKTALTPYADARVIGFWGGVYKRFLVRGPVDLSVAIDRNHSLNTKMCGLMVDVPGADRMVGYDMTAEQWRAQTAATAQKRKALFDRWTTNRAEQASTFAPCADAPTAAAKLLDGLDLLRQWNPQRSVSDERQLAVLLARSAADARASWPSDVRARCFLAAGLYDAWDRTKVTAGQRTHRQMEKALRWDQVSADDSGRGYEALSRYR